jgi:hypothetical protein
MDEWVGANAVWIEGQMQVEIHRRNGKWCWLMERGIRLFPSASQYFCFHHGLVITFGKLISRRRNNLPNWWCIRPPEPVSNRKAGKSRPDSECWKYAKKNREGNREFAWENKPVGTFSPLSSHSANILISASWLPHLAQCFFINSSTFLHASNVLVSNALLSSTGVGICLFKWPTLWKYLKNAGTIKRQFREMTN